MSHFTPYPLCQESKTNSTLSVKQHGSVHDSNVNKIMFKDYFKYYKSRNPPPNLENVIDVNKSTKVIINLLQFINYNF